MSNYFNNSEGIDAWFIKRRAKFTSSTNWKLNSTPAAFSAYVEEKVIELTTSQWERPEMEEVKSLLWGRVYEYPAFESYVKETKNYSMTYIGRENPIFYPDETMPEESGGSPDGANILENGKVDYGMEIKCPKNPANHFRRLKWESQWDIKENYFTCYAQIQDLIRITGAFGWDFISYDERQLSPAKRKVIIEVKPDRKFIDNLELIIKIAIKDKYKLLSEHMGVELKNRTDYLNFLKQ